MNLDDPITDGRQMAMVANALGQELAMHTACVTLITQASGPLRTGRHQPWPRS